MLIRGLLKKSASPLLSMVPGLRSRHLEWEWRGAGFGDPAPCPFFNNPFATDLITGIDLSKSLRQRGDRIVPSPTATPPPRRAPWPLRLLGGMLGLVVLTLLVVITGVFGGYLIMTERVRGESVLVPNLTRQTTDEALAALAPMGLSLAFDDNEYNDIVPEGAILRQRPRPGLLAKRGTSVRVTLSRGPALAAVPDLTGLSLIDAETALQANDLTAGATSRLHSATHAVDEVIAQVPAAGEGLRRGQSVHLLASLGPAAAIHTAPDLTGLTVREAEWALGPYGCTVGESTERVAPLEIEAGTILEQTPAVGSRLESGTALSVVLARRR